MLSRQMLASASILALLLVATVPVEGTPALQKGTHSTYSLNVAISFLETCETLGTTTLVSSAIVCPMIATFPMSTNISGTVAWAVIDLTSTAVSLNVAHDLTISSDEATQPTIPNTGSFNESIDLASRLVNFFPGMPEMDQFLQTAQTAASTGLPGMNLTSSITMLESFMPHRSVYTMWWVNGPLKLNETVPVLILPTTVTRSSNVDLGGTIGNRDTWSLDFNFSRPVVVPDPSPTPTSIPVPTIDARAAFDYDKASDLLLSATAELHSGFEDVFPISPHPCVPSASMTCPATPTPTIILGNIGVDIKASLKLISTDLDLSQRMTLATPPQSSGASDNGNGSGTNGGTGSGKGSNGASSYNNGNGANGPVGQPSSATNKPALGDTASSWPFWTLGLLGVFAAIIIASTVWISRRRRRNDARPNSEPGQASS